MTMPEPFCSLYTIRVAILPNSAASMTSHTISGTVRLTSSPAHSLTKAFDQNHRLPSSNP